MSDSDSGEEYDTFHTSDAISGGGETSSFLFDSASIAHVTATAEASASQTSQPNQRRNRFTSVGSSRSAATTQLATDVGSTMISSRVPFLKSVTFFDPKIYYRRDREGAVEEESETPPAVPTPEAEVVCRVVCAWAQGRTMT